MSEIKFNAETTVDSNNTAKAVKSGNLNVFSTPMMIALMEEASTNVVSEYIEENCTTVGTYIEVKHTSATLIGSKVGAVATITKRTEKKFFLAVKAYDEKGLIGEGVHKRAIVNIETFMENVSNKKVFRYK